MNRPLLSSVLSGLPSVMILVATLRREPVDCRPANPVKPGACPTGSFVLVFRTLPSPFVIVLFSPPHETGFFLVSFHYKERVSVRAYVTN